MQTLMELSGRETGDLIKHDDWNDLVEHVAELGRMLQNQVDGLTMRLDGLAGNVAELTPRLDAVEQRLGDLVAGKFRVTLAVERQRFLVGDQAEIVAQLTDLEGNPVSFAGVAEAALPWLDFVTVWGRFRSRGGNTRIGAESRSVSVQVDDNGSARVTLLAENVEGVSSEVEDEVAGTITTEARRAIFEAETPAQAQQRGAFNLFTLEYQRSDALAFREFSDTRFQNLRFDFAREGLGILTHSWRDYRTAVLAFVANDDDPTTADLSHGGASVTLTFRDWTGPWLDLDFLLVDSGEVGGLSRELGLAIAQSRTFEVASGNLGLIFQAMRQETGFLGGIRARRLLGEALDQVEIAEPPDYFPVLQRTFRDSLALEDALGGGGAGAEVVMNLALHAEAGAGAAGEQLAGVEESVAGLAAELADAMERNAALQASLADLGARTRGLESTTEQLDQRFDSVDTRFGQFDNRVTTIDTNLNQFGQLAQRAETRTENLPQRLQRLDLLNQRFEVVDQGVLNLRQEVTTLSEGSRDVGNELLRIERGLADVGGRLENTASLEMLIVAQDQINQNLITLQRSVPNFNALPIRVRR